MRIHIRNRRVTTCFAAGAVTLALLAGCGQSSDDPSDEAAAEPPSSVSVPDGATPAGYSAFLETLDSGLVADDLADMTARSSAVIVGRVTSVEAGRVVETEVGDAYYADVLVSVDEQLKGSLRPEGQTDAGEAHMEFYVGFDPEVLDSLTAALPSGEAVWFLQDEDTFLALAAEDGLRPKPEYEAQREPNPAYSPTDLEAGVVVEDEDGTVGFPFVDETPHAEAPEDQEEAEEEAGFPADIADTMTYSALIEQVRAS